MVYGWVFRVDHPVLLKSRDWISSIGARTPDSVFLALSVLPIVVALTWGTIFDDGAHVVFSAARNLAAGREWAYGLAMEGVYAPVSAPIYTLALAGLARLGAPPSQVVLVSSALGWTALCWALYCFVRISEGPWAAGLALALAVSSPVLLSALGSAAIWAVAWFWLAALAGLRKRWLLFDVALVWMLLTHSSTLALALLLVGWKWSVSRRFPLGASVVVAGLGLGWLWLALRTWGVGVLRPSWMEGRLWLNHLLRESQLYWLYLPLMSLGALAVRKMRSHRGLLCVAVVLWWGLALTGAGPTAQAGAATVTFLLSTFGIAWAVRWVQGRELSGLREHTLGVGLSVLVSVLLLYAQLVSFGLSYRERPTERRALERYLGAWLDAHNPSGQAVLGSGHIDYPTELPVLLWEARSGGQADLSALLDVLRVDTPGYVIAERTIPWDRLVRSGWFGERYERALVFSAPHDATSSFTVWRYRAGGFDRGGAHPVDVALTDGIRLTGARYWPEQIKPGDAVFVTLSLQATRPVSTAVRSIVRVLSLLDGVNYAQQDVLTPHSVPVDWWRTGQTIDERYVLTTTTDTPVGAYHLDVFVLGEEERRQVLGYVAVPWQGVTAAMTPVGALLSDEIELLGYEAAERWERGTAHEVTLYWHGAERPREDYTVFVHLVGPDGQAVAGHDGQPMEGTYPTRAWSPGDTIPDTHRLALEPDLAPGYYTLQVGMYRRPSLERLPIWDADGVAQADGLLVLQTIEVR